MRAYQNAIPPALAPFQGKTIDELDIKDGVIFEKANPENKLPVAKVTSLQPRGLEAAAEGGSFFVGDKAPELPE